MPKDLFYDGRLSDYLAQIKQRIEYKFSKLKAQDVKDKNATAIVEEIISENQILVPKILRETISMREPEQVQVPSRGYGQIFNQPRTQYVIIYHYSGSEKLFYLLPSQYEASFPRAEVHGDELHLIYHIPVGSDITPGYEKDVSQIEKYLSWVGKDVESFFQTAKDNLIPRVQEKIDQINKASAVAIKMGIPIMPPATKQGVPIPAKSKPTNYDAFISHASEDKPFVTPLAKMLQSKGLDIWYDDFILKVGDSLRRSIDNGLSKSKYGIVIISRAFFSKEWPQKELDGLFAKECFGGKVILPIWYNIEKNEVVQFSPILADKKAIISQGKTLETICADLLDTIKK